MAEALTTIDALVASVWQSYVAANKLILNSTRPANATETKNTRADDALQQQAQFIISNTLGKSSSSIPLAKFYSNSTYHLSDLRLDIPCYTMSGVRFLGDRQENEFRILHLFAPTRRQRLFHVCHLYHLVIKINRGVVEVEFLPSSAEEAMRLAEESAMRPAPRIAWKLRLTSAQQRHLRTLPQIAAKPVYWRSGFERLLEWFSGKSKQNKQGK